MSKLRFTVVALVLALPSVGWAVDLTLPVTSQVVISNGRGGSRILLDFGAVGTLHEEAITSARLILPMSGAVPPSDLVIAVSGLTRAWGATATWTSPWAVPGGDRDPDESVHALVQGGRPAGTVDIDVEDLVQAMVDGDAPHYGFLLHPDEVSRMGFTATEMAAIGALSEARVVVTYRSLKALGMRGGAPRFVQRRQEAIRFRQTAPPAEESVPQDKGGK